MEVRSPLKWFQLEPKWPPVKITAVRCWRTKTANCVCKFGLRQVILTPAAAGGKQALLPPVVCTPTLTDIVYSATAPCLQHTHTATVSQRNVAQPKHNQSGHLFAILTNQFIQMFGRNTLAMLLSLGSSWIGSVVAATQSGTGHDAAAHAKENMEQGCKNESRPNCVSLEFQTHWISGSETILCNVMYNCTFPIRSEPTEGVNKMVKAVSSENNSFAVCYYWMVVWVIVE